MNINDIPEVKLGQTWKWVGSHLMSEIGPSQELVVTKMDNSAACGPTGHRMMSLTCGRPTCSKAKAMMVGIGPSGYYGYWELVSDAPVETVIAKKVDVKPEPYQVDDAAYRIRRPEVGSHWIQKKGRAISGTIVKVLGGVTDRVTVALKVRHSRDGSYFVPGDEDCFSIPIEELYGRYEPYVVGTRLEDYDHEPEKKGLLR